MNTYWSVQLLKYPDGLYKVQHHDCLCEVTPYICEFESFIAQNECSHLKKKSSTQVIIAKIILYPPTELETSTQL